MFPILFSVGNINIHSYGFMIAIAFIVGIFISMQFGRKVNIKPEIILDLAIYVMIGAIVGSRAMYVIGQWDKYKDNIIEIFMVQQGGLAFLGGFALVVGIIALYAKLKQIPMLRLLDVLAPGAALGYAIARVGCFLNGCCFGVPAGVPWAIKFVPGSLAHFHYPGLAVHPTQLYALAAMALVFIVMTFIWPKRKYDGQVFFWWLILYSVYRFVVEIYRYCPDDLIYFGLKPGQIIAIIMLVIGIGGIRIVTERLKKS